MDGATGSIWDRQELLRIEGGPRDRLEELGLKTRLYWTHFGQSQIRGDGNHSLELGGRGDLYLTADLSRFGLWQGLSLSVHGQIISGNDVNNQGDGSLLPINTALAFPRLSGSDEDFSSVYFTQKFTNDVTLSVGKIDMLDVISRTPLIGGGGINTFQNLAFAAPPTGLVPPSIFGALINVPVGNLKFTLGVYDPQSATGETGLDDPFKEGVTGMLGVGITTSVGGLPSYHSVSIKANNKEGLDLEDLRGLELPPVSEIILGNKKGAWNIAYSFQQYLWSEPSNPNKGWGLFVQLGLSDGNPTPIDWSGYVGIGGNSPIPGRSDDRFGAGYFYLSLSDDLTTGLNRIGKTLGIDTFIVEDESGAEVFYNAAIAPWFRLSVNLQVINTHESRKETAIFKGLSVQVFL
jgi:porin